MTWWRMTLPGYPLGYLARPSGEDRVSCYPLIRGMLQGTEVETRKRSIGQPRCLSALTSSSWLDNGGCSALVCSGDRRNVI